MNDHLIFGIHVKKRLKRAGQVQELLSEYGCHIRTRLGLHEASPGVCSPDGLILLEMIGDRAACRELATKLAAVDGVEVHTMEFTH